jgi:hypothetical protein
VIRGAEDSIEPSASESDRFGLRIGRWTPGSPDAVSELDDAALDAYDVVVVRQPAAWADRWVALMRYDDHVALHADTLVYWSWRDTGAALPTVSGTVRQRTDETELASLVRDVFDDYQNHYASNPLLARSAALEGYVEWAERTAAASGGFVTVDDGQGPIGFALVDWTVDPPDVRLAGLCRRARGSGRYRDVAAAMMDLARWRGSPEIVISTQVQNIAVQRIWAALGWRPTSAYDTTHLVRRTLLVDALTRRGGGTHGATLRD